MKLTIILIVIGSALAAETANNILLPSPLYNGIDYKASAFKGVRCAAKEVMAVNRASLKFINEIRKCNKNVGDNVAMIDTAVREIISNANSILEINKNNCGNSDEKENSKISRECYSDLYDKNMEFKDKIHETVALIKAPGIKEICIAVAVVKLQSVLVKFPEKVEKCFK